ncbi:hypothetical protein RIF23_16060 [Lipingzhangella sp. LS1_29]|uniref:Uncharacterized protein n=1 Tax=Lipingzhangella rawalii TaxID=2055835 RepID=A0ABU2H924_9ACTN|nr:hypothetical protein [Lipingzhangella rawalii]MDS1271808.1 hypothetical protein [Lipingzhangella rawalii]
MPESSPIGLYSISVRGLDVEELLEWAFENAIPFLHLRGGPRGFDLAHCSADQLERWRQKALRSVPITGITADVDLAELVDGDEPTRRGACDRVHRLSAAADRLEAHWVRLLARVPFARFPEFQCQSVLPAPAVPLLVELHHPRWLHPDAFAALEALMRQHRHVRVLADTAQLGAALTQGGNRDVAAAVLEWSTVLHLSDDGAGLVAPPAREEIAALAAHRMACGQAMEVALEWTGPDRTPQACLEHYRSALAWWVRIRHQPGRT